jgi:hypothetical protein
MSLENKAVIHPYPKPPLSCNKRLKKKDLFSWRKSAFGEG